MNDDDLRKLREEFRAILEEATDSGRLPFAKAFIGERVGVIRRIGSKGLPVKPNKEETREYLDRINALAWDEPTRRNNEEVQRLIEALDKKCERSRQNPRDTFPPYDQRVVRIIHSRQLRLNQATFLPKTLEASAIMVSGNSRESDGSGRSRRG